MLSNNIKEQRAINSLADQKFAGQENSIENLLLKVLHG